MTSTTSKPSTMRYCSEGHHDLCPGAFDGEYCTCRHHDASRLDSSLQAHEVRCSRCKRIVHLGHVNGAGRCDACERQPKGTIDGRSCQDCRRNDIATRAFDRWLCDGCYTRRVLDQAIAANKMDRGIRR